MSDNPSRKHHTREDKNVGSFERKDGQQMVAKPLTPPRPASPPPPPPPEKD